MKKRQVSIKGVGGVFLVITVSICLMTLGCDDPRSAPQKALPTYDVSFVSSSQGLPSVGQWRQGIGFFDMNSDGHLDILAPPPRKAPDPETNLVPRIWYGNGKGEWSAAAITVPRSGMTYFYGDICGNDFDGDGIPDMALAMHDIGVRVLRGVGDGKYVDFSEPLNRIKYRSRTLVQGDFSGDGRPEIAAVAEPRMGKDQTKERGVAVMNLIEKGWRFRYIDEKGSFGLFADDLAVGDVNGDGNLDLAVGSLVTWKDLVVWLNDGSGGFSPFNDGLPEKIAYISVSLADVNNDDKDDLIFSFTGFGKVAAVGLKAFTSGEKGFEEFSEGLPQDEAFYTVTTGDLTHDGRNEIVGVTQQGGIKIYGLKGTRWSELQVDGLPKEGIVRGYGVHAVDVNGDGYADIAVNYADSESDKGGIEVFLNVPKQEDTH